MITTFIHAMEDNLHIELSPSLLGEQERRLLHHCAEGVSKTFLLAFPSTHPSRSSVHEYRMYVVYAPLVGLVNVGCSLYVTLSKRVAGSSSPLGPKTKMRIDHSRIGNPSCAGGTSFLGRAGKRETSASEHHTPARTTRVIRLG